MGELNLRCVTVQIGEFSLTICHAWKDLTTASSLSIRVKAKAARMAEHFILVLTKHPTPQLADHYYVQIQRFATGPANLPADLLITAASRKTHVTTRS